MAIPVGIGDALMAFTHGPIRVEPIIAYEGVSFLRAILCGSPLPREDPGQRTSVPILERRLSLRGFSLGSLAAHSFSISASTTPFFPALVRVIESFAATLSITLRYGEI